MIEIIEILTEYVRQGLYRIITDKIKGADGDIPLYTLDKKIEDTISDGLQSVDNRTELSIDPNITQNILVAEKTISTDTDTC